VRVVPTSLVAALILGFTAVPAVADTTTTRLIVGVTHDADRAALVAKIGDLALGWRPIEGLDAITVDVPSDDVLLAYNTWGSDPAIRYRMPDYQLHADESGDQTSPLTYKQLNRVAGAQTWTTGSPSITVAVVDTGVTPNKDLPAERLTPGYDFVDGDTDPADDGTTHGTLIAGVIAGDAGPGALGTGVCPQCRVMPVRALKYSSPAMAGGWASDVAAGIVWATDHGARIINVSASSYDVDIRLMPEAIAHAAAAGVLVVASSGHGPNEYVGYPANIDPVVAVGAHNSAGYPLGETNGNTAGRQWLDTSAAGYAVAMDPAGTLRYSSGSSAASAAVAGTAALAYTIRPDLTATDLRDRIRATSSPGPQLHSYDAPIFDATRLMMNLGAEDTQAPVVTRTGLNPGQHIPGTSDTIVPAIATDDHAVERMEMLLDGKVVSTWLPWSRTMTLRAPAGYQGSYPVTIRAYDYAGHTAERSTTVALDAVGPTGQFVRPAAEEHVSGIGAIGVVITSPDADLLTATANNIPMEHQNDGTWVADVVPSADGVIDVLLSDWSGNETRITRHVVLDKSGPTATGISPMANMRVHGTFTSTITGVQDASGVASAQLWVNGALLGTDTTAPYSVTVKTGSSGPLTMIWQLTDSLGNARYYSRKVTVLK